MKFFRFKRFPFGVSQHGTQLIRDKFLFIGLKFSVSPGKQAIRGGDIVECGLRVFAVAKSVYIGASCKAATVVIDDPLLADVSEAGFLLEELEDEIRVFSYA